MSAVLGFIVSAFTSNPLVSVKNSCQDNVCCIKGDAIVVKVATKVQNNPQFKLKKTSCFNINCCTSSTHRKGLEGKVAIIQLLTKQYGMLNTLSAFQLAGVDPDEMLTVGDLQQIATMLQGAVDNQEKIKGKFKAAQYYHEASHHVTMDKEAVVDPDLRDKFDPSQFSVSKSDREDRMEEQEFSEEKILAGLQRANFATKPDPETVTKMIDGVKSDLVQMQQRSHQDGSRTMLNAADIRARVINQIALHNLELREPRGYTQLLRCVQDQFSEVRHFRDLSVDAYSALTTHVVEERSMSSAILI
jgi:transcriptional regulator NrdR family protein